MRSRALQVGVVMVFVACRSRTELMIGVATDLSAPDAVDRVTLSVTRTDDGTQEDLVDWDITGTQDLPFNLPGSYGIFSSDGSPVSLDLQLTATRNNAMVVERHAIVSLVPDQTLFFRMSLVASCEQVGCADGMACVEGTCKDVHVDTAVLPDFDPELVDHVSCNSGTTFIDTSTGAPMPPTPDAATCPAGMCSEGTCNRPPSASGCIVPMVYRVDFNCESSSCGTSYPGMNTTLDVDGTGNGDFAADLFLGIDGTCSSTANGCSSQFMCAITTGGAGSVMGSLNWLEGGRGADGMALYILNDCPINCRLTLSPR